MPLPTEPEAKLPQPPEGTTWISRGWGWTNDGKPAVHCTRSHRRPRVIQSKSALVPAGGVDYFYWEAVPVGDEPFDFTPDPITPQEMADLESLRDSSQEPGFNPIDKGNELTSVNPATPITVIPSRTIEVVHAIPEPVAPAVPVSDPAFDAAWAAWRRSPQGIANASVRGLDVSRLWTIMEARIRATFEAGYNSRNRC